MKEYRKLSRFFKWAVTYVTIFVFIIIIYVVLDVFGKINEYCINVRQRNGIWPEMNIGLIFVTAIIYGFFSLYNLFSHRAVEDGRMHCLSIILSAFFLILENALLHAGYIQNSPGIYYQVTMGVFSTAALGIITFASLKFSFELSTKQKLLFETSSVKPYIIIRENKGKFKAKIERNSCYLCGVYIGKIEKINYLDIKRTGNKFVMSNLYFPNRRKFYEKDFNGFIQLTDISADAPDLNEIYKKNYTYLIFRDMQNYYYFVKLPSRKDDYKVVGVNENVINRLVYKFNRAKDKDNLKNIKYEAMDIFNIPYNFYPEYEDKI